VKPLEYPLLLDENIGADLVAKLRATGKDVRTVHDEGLTGSSDVLVLRRAHQQGRVVLTHDRDFGTLAVHADEPYVGIVYLRPGHISVAFVEGTIAAIESSTTDVEPPFLVVAERRADVVRIRVRRPSRNSP
jgi:predicted nuclease of predicted toxin-antitoxin system